MTNEQDDILEFELEDTIQDAPPEVDPQIVLSFNEQVDRILKLILRGESNLSFSSLNQFAETPADFIKYKMALKVTTPAMLYGSMLHCKVLEPEDFENRYYIIDDDAKKAEIGGAKPGATTMYKDWKKAQDAMAAGSGKIVVTKGDVDTAIAISNQVKYNTAASRILNICPERESKVQWEYNNYKFVGIKDMSGPDAICDLKSMPDANPRKVEMEITKKRIYLQAAMYLHADKATAIANGEAPRDKDYYIIAVDKKGGVSCHQLDKALLQKGADEYEYYVSKFSECILAEKFDYRYEFYADRYDGIYTAKKLW